MLQTLCGWWREAPILLRVAVIIELAGLAAAVAFEVSFARSLCSLICEEKQMTVWEVERANGIGIFDVLLPALSFAAIALARPHAVGASILASLPVVLFAIEAVRAGLTLVQYPYVYQWLTLEMTTLGPPALACALTFIEAVRSIRSERGGFGEMSNEPVS